MTDKKEILNKLPWIIVAIAFLMATSCCKPGDAYSEFSIEEQYYLRGLCEPDCSPGYWSFSATSPRRQFTATAISVSITPDHDGFAYCMTYFDEQVCGESDLDWNQIAAGALSFPCGDHTSGYLIEASRGDFAEEGGFTLPSYWLAYADGHVAAAEGDAVDELMPMFRCSGN